MIYVGTIEHTEINRFGASGLDVRYAALSSDRLAKAKKRRTTKLIGFHRFPQQVSLSILSVLHPTISRTFNSSSNMQFTLLSLLTIALVANAAPLPVALAPEVIELSEPVACFYKRVYDDSADDDSTDDSDQTSKIPSSYTHFYSRGRPAITKIVDGGHALVCEEPEVEQ